MEGILSPGGGTLVLASLGTGTSTFGVGAMDPFEALLHRILSSSEPTHEELVKGWDAPDEDG